MCDTWVALKDATLLGSVIFAKNSDRPIFDCQPLVFFPHQEWPAGSRVQLEYLEIPQPAVTYATIGSSPYWCWGYEEGINEHRVVIGNEAVYTRVFREAVEAYRAGSGPQVGLLGMDLVRLALERASSAAQAVEVLGALVERYGQFGSGVPTRDHAEGSYDNSFLIADPRESWVFEAIGQRWVARRFERGSTSISNQLSIRKEWDAGSADLADYALSKGWWDAGMPFDVAHAYIDQSVPRQISQIRAMRSRQLLQQQSGAITPEWMMRIARDHYEDTFLEGPFFDPADPDFLSLCMHSSPARFTWGNTASSCVVALPEAADQVPVFWWTPGPPCNGCYVPFFVQGTRLPTIVSQAGIFGKQVVRPDQAAHDTFAPDSYWWLFRQLIDTVKGDATGARPGYYQARNQMVRQRFDGLESRFAAEVPDVLRHYAANGDPQILDTYMEQCVGQVTTEVRKMLKEL